MARYTLLLFGICLTSLHLFLLHGCAAQLELPQQGFWQELRHQQQHRLRAKTSCQIQKLNAREPDYRYEFEAGSTEFWDSNSEEFECAGIQLVRHNIEPNGLLLPYYANAPQLIYIVQGSGVQGTVIPGCAESYESESESESESSSSQREGEGGSSYEREGRRWSSEGGSQSQRRDRHQKLRRFRQGDILALPEGFTHWAYNDGDKPIISVSLLDVGNDKNQLDLNFRKFFLAGNLQSTRREGQSQRGQGQEGQGSRGRSQRDEGREQRGEQEQGDKRNVFNGFDEELLAEAFNVDSELIRKLQGQEDNRGAIVKAERLRFILPEYGREEQERQQREEQGREGRRGERREWEHEGRRGWSKGGEGEHEGRRGWSRGQDDNGIEETFCTFKIHQNIDTPARADFFNPRGGRITTVNSHTLPILGHVRLSAERGILYKNALVGPRFSINAHSAIYVTRGRGRIQVVGNQGNTVFDGEVNQGQLLVIPQNFVVVKKASEDGLEWISLKTNDNAMSSSLAGRLSAFRSIPVGVLQNAYDITREDAWSLKRSRKESTIFSSESESGSKSERGSGRGSGGRA